MIILEGKKIIILEGEKTVLLDSEKEDKKQLY